MDKPSRFGILAVFLLVLCSLTVWGQSITGDLVVTALDPQSAVVPGARLTLIAVDTDLHHEGTTDANGAYVFGQLQPGVYRLVANAPGFQAAQLVNIRIDLGQRAKVDVNFKMGDTTTTIEVSAGAATLLNVENATVGQVIQERTLNELPLNGRNFVQLAQLSPGVTPVAAGHSSATVWTGRTDTTVSIAGLRESNVSYLLNGIETRNSRFGTPGIRPSVDAIQEFRVQHSTFGAEYGRSAAVINTTLRSGSNDLHLSLFELMRNRKLDANNFFSNAAGQELPAFTQNNFGTTLAGPVVLPKLYNGRNRTFFMFNYEGYRQRESLTRLSVYPSAAQWAGNLADDSTGTGLYPTHSSFCKSNPGSAKCVDVIDPTTGQAFPNNVIPTSRLSSIIQKFQAYTPTPNVAVASGGASFPAFNTVSTPASSNDWDQYNARIDHKISDKDMLYGSFSNSDEFMLDPGRRFLGGMTYPMSNRLWTMTYNRIFTPNLINEFRFGFNDSKTYQQSEGSNGVDYASLIGLKNTSSNPFDFGVPYINFDGFNSIGTTPEAIGATDTNVQFTDNLSWVKGKHNFQAGLQASRQMYYQITDFNGNPTFNFDGRYTGIQGIGLADMLLGTPYSVAGAIGDSSQDERSTFLGGYIQDSWRIAPNFTINLGLRYEFSSPPSEIRNRAIYFSPELGKVVYAADGAVRSSIVDPDYNNFAPRIGISYSPSFLKRTVIRAGAGTYYSTDQLNGEQWKIIGGTFYQSQSVYSDPTTPTLSMSNMMPSFTATKNSTPFTWDRLSRTPYVNQWSFDIQHAFTDSTVLELGYLGSTSQKTTARRNYNIATIDPTGTIPISQRTRYSDYSAILMAYNGGWASYQAFTARLEKRFSSGLSFLAAYTFAKSLDLADFSENSTVSSGFKNWDKGHSTSDVPHRLVLSYTWELPFGKGKSLLNGGGVVSALAGGWQVNGITTFSTGQFESVTLASDWVNLGSFTVSRPDAVGDYTAGRTYPYHYLNASAFDYPRDSAGNAIHVEGNSGRNIIQMPGVNNFDLSLFRNVKFKERYNIQIRAEGFNVFNHTQWGNPDLIWGSPTFGQISSTLVDARRMQLGLKVSF